MTKLSQKESVFQAVLEVLDLPSVEGKIALSKEQKKSVVSIIVGSINTDETEFSVDAKAKHDTVEKLSSYVGGLVNNWLRKDTRLNGGEIYQIQNPGSRVGQGDEVLKELKKLHSSVTDPAHREAIDSAIEARKSEMTALKVNKKATAISIDVSKIPEELRHLIPTQA